MPDAREYGWLPPDKAAILMAKFFVRGPFALMRARPVRDVVMPTLKTTVEGKEFRYHPTQAPIAEWADERVMTEGIDNFNFGDFEVEQMRPEFDIRRINLKPSPLFPQFGKVLATEDVKKKIEEQIPVDGTEIVEWMHDAMATLVVMSAREEEYNVHSQFECCSGDPFSPGVRTRNMAFERIRGSKYVRRGYATVVSPAGRINVPRSTLKPIIGQNFLGWAFAGYRHGVQWHGALGEFIRLADKITSTIGFPNIYGRVAPLFVLQQPDRQTERAKVRMVFHSSKDQRVKIVFRDPNDYTRVLDEGWVDIPKGQSTVEFYVASYPSVPPVVDQIQPADQTSTALDRFEVLR